MFESSLILSHGNYVKFIGTGCRTGLTYNRILSEVVEDFFMDAAEEIKLSLSTIQPRTYKIAKRSKTLKKIGEIQESKFGVLGKEYKRIVFDRKLLEQDARSDWVTPDILSLKQCGSTMMTTRMIP